MNYIKNLTLDESHLLIFYLSKNNDIQKQQIDILNNESELLQDPTKTLSAFNTDGLLKSVYDLIKIETLSEIVVKTSIGETGFFNKKTDILGSSLGGAFFRIYNSADIATKTLLQLTAAEIKEDISIQDSIQNREYKLNNFNLIASWVDEKIYNILNKENDIFLYKQKIAKNTFLNLNKTSYMSPDYITFLKQEKNQEYIELIYQSFMLISEEFINIKKIIRRIQDLVNKYHINIYDSIVPEDRIKEIEKNITIFLGKINDKSAIFLKTFDVTEFKDQFFSDLKNRDIILSALEEIKGFAGSSIKKYTNTEEQQKDFINTLKQDLNFKLSVPLFYYTTAPVIPIKYTTYTRELTSEYHDTTYSAIYVDTTGNKTDYLDTYIKNKLI